MNKWMYLLPGVFLLGSCCWRSSMTNSTTGIQTDSIIRPVIVTDSVMYDTDDPAIWVNPTDPSKSLILGTDKEEDGALYVFDLQGKVVADKVVRNLKRPNNVDVEYGLSLNNKPVDIAVVTERFTKKLRVYSLPGMKPVDNGGLDMFAGETGFEHRDLMGISLYKDPLGKVYAIVGRKNGPKEGEYLWQYLLEDDGHGMVKASLVRKFGRFSGIKEIESIAVDDKLGIHQRAIRSLRCLVQQVSSKIMKASVFIH
jgi:3-phytase